jgi:predicted amidohydrolase YtcJ
MRKIIALIAASLGMFFAFQKAHSPRPQLADLLIRNARVYTVDARQPWAQAIAIERDRISWVGDDKDAAAYIGPNTKVIDAGSRMVLPGFIDSHFHVLLGGNPDVLRIENGNSLADIQRQVRAFAEKRPQLKWIEVEGWNYSAFPHGTLPTARDLEGLTGGRPAFLVAYDYHTIWMNRQALKEFGITRNTHNVIFAEKLEKDRNASRLESSQALAAPGSPSRRRRSCASTCRPIPARPLSAMSKTMWPRRCALASPRS